MNSYTEHLQRKLASCLDILAGVITPGQSFDSSLFVSPRDIGQEGNMKAIKTWKAKENQLFMNLTKAASNVEFPCAHVHGKGSPRAGMKRIAKNQMKKQKMDNARRHTQVGAGMTMEFDVIREETHSNKDFIHKDD